MILRKRAFTLVEILIALAISAVLTVTVYELFSNVWLNYNKGSIIIDLDRSSRIVLEYLKRDLREACTNPEFMYSVIVEDPDKTEFGNPKADAFGESLYEEGYSIKFYRFSTPGDFGTTVKELQPKAVLVKYSFIPDYIGQDGKQYKAVIRYQDSDGDTTNGYEKKRVLAKFSHKSKAFLYFVKFSVGEITDEVIKNGDAPPEMNSFGLKHLVRIYFVAEAKYKSKVEHVPLMMVIAPRQINANLADSFYKLSIYSRLNVPAPLMPDLPGR
jgi:prepilin-type N-terminal cleavage/methylation domain-containing protein